VHCWTMSPEVGTGPFFAGHATIDERAAPVCKLQMLVQDGNDILPLYGFAAVDIHVYVRETAGLFEVVAANVAGGDWLDE